MMSPSVHVLTAHVDAGFCMLLLVLHFPERCRTLHVLRFFVHGFWHAFSIYAGLHISVMFLQPALTVPEREMRKEFLVLGKISRECWFLHVTLLPPLFLLLSPNPRVLVSLVFRICVLCPMGILLLLLLYP